MRLLLKNLVSANSCIECVVIAIFLHVLFLQPPVTSVKEHTPQFSL